MPFRKLGSWLHWLTCVFLKLTFVHLPLRMCPVPSLVFQSVTPLLTNLLAFHKLKKKKVILVFNAINRKQK